MAARVWIPSGGPQGGYATAIVSWADNSTCTFGPDGTGGYGPLAPGTRDAWVDLAEAVVAPHFARSARFMLLGEQGVYFDRAYFGTGTCAPSPTQLCLSQGRFQVQASWTKPDQTTGPGMAVPLAADSGSFWFFSPTNIELDVKVLNACVPSLGNYYWVFAAGLTNVKVVLTVTDTQTGAVRTYTNQQGTVFQPITDTSAFATCP